MFLNAQCVALVARDDWFEWLTSWGVGLFIIAVSASAAGYWTWRLARVLVRELARRRWRR